MLLERLAQHFVSVDEAMYRAIPADPPIGSPNDPLDAGFAARSKRNRWNASGEPTLYLARDLRSLATEWARYVDEQPPAIADPAQSRQRRIFAIQVTIDRVVDLRSEAVCAILGLTDPPYGFMRDRELCRQIAGRLRRETDARAIIAPSMGLLDQPEHWTMALFVEKLPTYPEPFLTRVERRGQMPVLA
jgi:hypothetical protein